MFPNVRMRRLRQNPRLRSLRDEISVNVDKLILPLFIRHSQGIKQTIPSMPGHFQISIDQLANEVQTLEALGIRKILLFGIPEHKDARGENSCAENSIIPTAIREIKKLAPDFLVISDVCLCEYTDHGHCGVLTDAEKTVDNDETLSVLAEQAIQHAKAGADIVAPSGSMDGMVAAIRSGLDRALLQNVPIWSYAVKYASNFYGPFRLAAEGGAKFGDRKPYQMTYANKNEAMRECELDIMEGADLLMVKPAHTYLDIIHSIKNKFPSMPLGAYHTSGEFVMLKAAAEKGWIDEKASVIEVLTAIHRAGADFIFTYYAKEVAQWLKEFK